ncbi:MAG: PqqD family protein [Ruminococcus sp.]|nr:PqqD family protein [Ruminococcus sp.]
MKLNENFLTHKFDDTQVLVATEKATFNGIAYSNKTAGYILECLQNEITEREIVNRMIKKFDVTEDIVKEDVKLILDKLRAIGAIEE